MSGMIEGFLTTAEVAELIRTPVPTILGFISRGAFKPPCKFAGNYAWSPADVERARKIMAGPRRMGRPSRKAVAHA